MSPTLQAYRADLARIDDLASRDLNPEDVDWQQKRYQCHDYFGAKFVEEVDYGGALDAYRASRLLAKDIVRQDPENGSAQRALSQSYQRIAEVYFKLGQHDEGKQAFHSGFAIRTRLADGNPENLLWQYDLFHGLRGFGDMLTRANLRDEALQTYREACMLSEQRFAQELESAHWQGYLSFSHDKIGAILFDKGQYEEALQSFRKCLFLHEKLEKGSPRTLLGQKNIARDHDKISLTLQRLGRHDESLKAQRDGQAIRDGFPKVAREVQEVRDYYR